MIARAAGLASAMALVGASACSNVIVGSPRAQSVPVRIRGTPPEATVTIDDQRVGSLAVVQARGMRVLPGRHRITVEKEGYLPFDKAVEAKDETVVVDVALVKTPD
ncbi:MAG TPA: PEGA domain-containing protein [Polyangiaceae bacterium]